MSDNSPTPYSPLQPNKGSPGSHPAYHAIPIPNRQARPSRTALSPGTSFRPNSISAFASSFHRAQSFRSIEPRINASRSYFQDDEELIDPYTFAPSSLGRKISTVFGTRPSIIDAGSTFDEAAVADDHSFADQSFNDYAALSRHPSFASSIATGGQGLGRILTNDTESLFVRQVENHDGKILTMVAPFSTVEQTIFNSINVLIGIGLLALSKAMTHAGWYCGCILMLYSVSITYWTANLLSDCMDTDPTLCTYADLGYKSFGPKARLFVSILFSVELLGVGVSLIVLFADSLNALFPSISLIQFKWIGFLVLTPFSFLSLRVLSGISLMGIISTISLVFIIFICGLLKKTSPGSLMEPVTTNLYPPSLLDLCVSYGIILGPFGSHSLFPALKADLITPKDFKKCLKITYGVGFFADASMALIGFLMFGAGILNEITQSVLMTQGYPKIVYFLISGFVSMIPIAKTPINAIPIINIIEFMFGLTSQQLDGEPPTFFQKSYIVLIKIFVNLMFVILAILYPEFDKIIGLSGASLCSLICVVLPCAFYVKLCKPKNPFIYFFVMAMGLILGSISTYAAIVS